MPKTGCEKLSMGGPLAAREIETMGQAGQSQTMVPISRRNGRTPTSSAPSGSTVVVAQEEGPVVIDYSHARLLQPAPPAEHISREVFIFVEVCG